MSAAPARAPALLALGTLMGSGLGVIGGLAEVIGQPLAEPLRVPYVLGADGLLGTAWGFAAGLLLLPRRRVRAKGLATAGGVLFGIVTFPALAAVLGLTANRALLSGIHFLSPVSLAADVIAVGAAAGGAALAGRAARRLLGRRPSPGPRPEMVAGAAALLLAAFLLPGSGRGESAADPRRPPIVLVSVDTLRPDRLSGGGEPRPTSPEIDRLCREGILFSEALTVSPGSTASHAALLTSRYPVSNGVWTNFSVMDLSVETLAETLRALGYRTGGFVTNTFLGRRFHFDQGFDAYVESGRVEHLEEPSRAAMFRSLALVQILDRLRHRLAVGHDPSFETALGWLREGGEPAFLFVHLMDVHSPYVPPRPYDARFAARPEGDPRAPQRGNRFGWRPSEEAYVAEIRFADAKVGRLRRLLAEEGMLDDGILVLTSDHGENLLDHEPYFSHGVTLFDATVRILAAIRAPGRIEPGRVEPTPFENVDVLPTLASILGWPRHPDWEGRSFAGGPAGEERPALAQLNRDYAIRTADRKIVVRESGEQELYRLDRDPGETRPRPVDAETAGQARAVLESWLDAHATALYGERAHTVRPEELSPETQEKLRALGYLD